MESAVKDLYSILGVAPHAPQAVIKAAYRALAKQYHPDGDGIDDPDRFIKLKEAYDVLSDDKRRAEYDESLLVNSRTAGRANRGGDDGSLDPDKVWSVKIKLRPEIESIYLTLNKYSTALGNRFRIAVIEGKCEEDPAGFAADLDKVFFLKYFGYNPEVHLLARKLLEAGQRRAARTLSKSVRKGKFISPQLSTCLFGVFQRMLEPHNDTAPETRKTKRQQKTQASQKRRAFTLNHLMRFVAQA